MTLRRAPRPGGERDDQRRRAPAVACQDLRVEGMHCASCGMLIDEALESLPGVVSSSTNVRRGRTRVEFDDAATDIASIARAIAELGYPAEPA